ncbi:MAG: OmpH family outer membrane protein [Maricaulaceae bacterium]|nr:OmpH family outer membrane protein [Maricaulaceae bacterium]
MQHRNPLWIFAVVATLFAAAAPANAQTNVLVISEERILAESAVGRHIGQQIEALTRQVDEELAAMGRPLQEENERLTAETSALTPEAIQQRQDLMQRIQTLNQQAQQFEATRRLRANELVATERQALRPVMEALEVVLQEIVSERGAQVLIDRSQLVYAHESVDITASVIERLNQRITTTPVNRVRLQQGQQQQ